MVGLLLITHDELGSSLISCVKHILGPDLPGVAAMAISKQDDPADALARARNMLRELDEGDGVLIMSDIFGGTPSNIACRLIEAGRIEAIAGVSLPMLVRAITYRNATLDITVSKAITGGLEGVRYVLPGECNAAT
ncbi:PTS fructose transporter subunit IIA [Chitinivorax sp. B]|uniref:PTS sugar transporter subunit IIA n=1 Tax=Chitinivorax sp. B TaxID=2502235 RepID=UPI0010FA23D0|nr:PTS fructose transporter subunit IIA [Chitinivorax sp. B]